MSSLLPLLLLAAAPDRHPDWMTGRWQFLSPSQQRGEACNGDGGGDQVVFSRRGYWVGVAIGDYGKWWISSDRLFQRTIDPGDGGSASDKGSIQSDRFRRIGTRELRFADGGRMVRCGRDVEGWFPDGKPF